MPKKKKVAIKKPLVTAEVETSDDQVEKPKRSLRPRCKAEASVLVERLSSKYLKSFQNKKNNDEENQAENAYDADSESDQNPESDSEVDEKRMTAELHSVTDSDVMMQDTSKTFLKSYNPFVIISKENITPPGSHSTPATCQRVVRNLDDSLLGFNAIGSPITCSPLNAGTVNDTSSSTASPSKRKRTRFTPFDVPVENPKKRAKKKTKKEPIPEVDPYEEIRRQFREIEMHELVCE